MPKFDLDSYSTVAERLAQFHSDYPDGRIATNLVSQLDLGSGKMNWVVRADVFLSAGDQANNLPKSTGYAAETDGTGGANNVAALPNAETSAIGRALMVMGYAMNKNPNALASREEMTKVVAQDWLEKAATLETIEQLRELYTQARASNAPKEVLERLKGYADRFAESQAQGTSRGVSDSSIQGKKNRG